MKIMLGKTKVRVVSVNDPNKSTKSDMKGKAAVTRVLPAKRRARRRKRRLRFSLEYKLLSGLRNLVSRASWNGLVQQTSDSLSYKISMKEKKKDLAS